MKKITLIMILIHLNIFSEEKYFIPIITDETSFITKKQELFFKNEEQVKNIFKDIFELHFKNWKEEFLREIEFNEKKYENKDTQELAENKLIEEKKLNKSLNILNNIISANNISISYAEACFKYALYSYATHKIDAKKARELLDKGLLAFHNPNDNKKLYVRMLLFAGDLALFNEQFFESQKYYKQILELKLNSDLFREEIIRAYIGYGDSEFEQFHFPEANLLYMKAMSFSKEFIAYSEDKYTLLIGEIYLRLIWSSFRNANYQLACEYSQEFARNKGQYDRLIPKNVIDDIIRIVAISLFELKDLNLYKKLSHDTAFGDFAKKMIINSFYYFIAGGYSESVEKYAKPIEKDFYSSRLFLEFINVRLIALTKINNIKKYSELSYYGSAFISKNSLWKSRFVLTDAEEESRKSIILKNSLQGGEYFYQLGVTTNSRDDFLKSAEIYNARIQENFEGDLRGVLFQLYAQSLLMAGDYKLAWDACEESLRQPLSPDVLKTSWFQLVNISRQQSNDTLSTASDEFKKYEKAVDGYIGHFPLDPQARLALFESAKRAELLGDLENAAERYEKILSLQPLYFKEQAQEEKDKVLLSLANLYLKIGPKNKSIPDAAGSLEKISDENKVSDIVNQVVMISNYTLAVAYAQKLKDKGELLNSAKFLELWSKNYNTNPNAGYVMILAIKEFATLQNWEHVYFLSTYFINNDSTNIMINEANFWLARSADMLLQFSMAASLYDKSSFNNDSFPDTNQKIFALRRAAEIYKYFQKNDDVARILEKISLIETKDKNINQNEISDLELSSAKIYFELKNYKLASNIYKKIISRKLVDDNIKEKAQIGLLAVSLYSDTNRNLAEKNYDNYIINLLNKVNKKKYNSINNINYAIQLVNTFDNEHFTIENNKNFSEIKMENINNMNLNKNYIKNRAIILKKFPDAITSSVHTDTLLGKMNAILSDTYAQYYKNGHKKEAYLVMANRLQSEAKSNLYQAMSNVKNNSEDKLLLSTLLSRYSKREFNITPEPKIQETQNSSYILQHLPASFGLSGKTASNGDIK